MRYRVMLECWDRFSQTFRPWTVDILDTLPAAQDRATELRQWNWNNKETGRIYVTDINYQERAS